MKPQLTSTRSPAAIFASSPAWHICQSSQRRAVIPVILLSATRPYGFERAEVERKLAAGEIFIGKPELKPGESLTLLDDGNRWGVVVLWMRFSAQLQGMGDGGH
jgi:hypothetical protein